MTQPKHLWICHIGVDFLPGVQDAARDAALGLKEIPGPWQVTVNHLENICIFPNYGLGAMRNMAIIDSLYAGADYVLLLENDVKLRHDTLRQLVETDKPAVVPYFDYAIPPYPNIVHPYHEAATGLRQIEWAVFSCVLFQRSVFENISCNPFTDIMIEWWEKYHWRLFALKGVPLWQQTDAIVDLLRKPTGMNDYRRKCQAWLNPQV